jgi:predicted TPR repeat methyltransferase
MTTAATRRQLDQAESHRQAGRAKQAGELYQQILQQEPANTEALFQLALLLCDVGQPAAAVDYFRQLLELRPDLADVQFNLATVLASLGRREEAIEAFCKTIALEPTMADAHNNLGILLRDCGQPERALACFEETLKHAPASLAARVNQVTTLVTLNRHKDAVDAGRRAVAEHPNAAEAHNALGLALDCSDRWDEAVQSFREAIRLKPDAEAWRYFLAARGGGGEAPARAPSKYVASLFDRYADRFDEHLVGALNYRTPQHLHEAVTAVAPAGRQFDIIDLGCGTGLCGELFRSAAGRLAGVDLSAQMIKAAERRGCYTELHVGDIATILRERPREFDLILAADVFVYVGDLAEIFALAAAALRPSGLFAFSVEAGEGDSFTLGRTGRYSHSLPYLRAHAAKHGFDERLVNRVALRTEGDAEVQGWVVVLAK